MINLKQEARSYRLQGARLLHPVLGMCIYSDNALLKEVCNSDPKTFFVEYRGRVIRVRLDQLRVDSTLSTYGHQSSDFGGIFCKAQKSGEVHIHTWNHSFKGPSGVKVITEKEQLIELRDWLTKVINDREE